MKIENIKRCSKGCNNFEPHTERKYEAMCKHSICRGLIVYTGRKCTVDEYCKSQIKLVNEFGII